MFNERVYRDAMGRIVYRVVRDDRRKAVYDSADRLIGYCLGERTVDVNGDLVANGEAPGALLR
ncbi:MAG: hypothetical protein U5K33_04430 [Halofilum sp. (in: g-proteobacteria)]|nr:hypothetical protein [Halofilum sp. (in: g-proteobacteria)]